MTSKPKTFQPSQFTPTQWDTAEDKAAFAKQFVRFVESDFAERHFTEKLYRRLSNTFGHIAHYDRGGFWAEFFTATADKIRFLEQALRWPCYGDPAFTYSDVERALQNWLRGSGVLETLDRKLVEDVEAAERAELARLQKKYA